MAEDKQKKTDSDEIRKPRLSPADRLRKRRRRQAIVLGALILLLAAAGGLHLWHKPFRVIGAGYVTTAARAEVRANDSGPIEQILVEDGDRVEKGQALITLSNRVQQADLALARANLARCEAALVQADGVELASGVQRAAVAQTQAELEHRKALLELRKLVVERTRTENVEAAKRAKAELDAALADHQRVNVLAQRDLIATEEVERSELNVKLKTSLYEVSRNTREEELRADLVALEREIDLARRNVEAARAAYAAALADARHRLAESQAELKIREARYAAREVRSPLTGFISLRNIEYGEIVGGGTPLGEIFDDSRGYIVRAKLKERYLNRIEPGAAAKIYFRAWPGRTFAGTVGKLSNIVTPQVDGDGFFIVEVELGPTDEALRPGLDAAITIEAGTISGLRWLMGGE